MMSDLRGHGSARLSVTTVDDYSPPRTCSRAGRSSPVSRHPRRDLTSGQISLLYDLIRGRVRTRSAGSRWVIAEARREEYVTDLALLGHKLRRHGGGERPLRHLPDGGSVVLVPQPEAEVDAAAVMRRFAAAARLRRLGLREGRDERSGAGEDSPRAGRRR